MEIQKRSLIMKQFIILFIGFIIISNLLISCEEKDDIIVTPVTPSNTMTAKVNGVDFIATTITGRGIAGCIYTKAVRGNNTIALDLDYLQATGTFNLSGNMYPRSYYIIEGEEVLCDSGTVVVSSHDRENHIIKGTFNFITVPSGDSTVYNITEGIFDVKYTTPF